MPPSPLTCRKTLKLTPSDLSARLIELISPKWMNFGDAGAHGEGDALVVYEAFMKVLPKDTKRGWRTMLRGAERKIGIECRDR